MFNEGQYADAKTHFDRFLREFPQSPLRGEALFGAAASLEAQGKSAEAATAFKDFVDRRPNDPQISRARLALARLTQAQNPEQAWKLYEEVINAERSTSTGYQAEMGLEELRRKHPELASAAPRTGVTTVPVPALN